MRIGDKVWHAKRKYIEDAEVAEYEKPKDYTTRFNYLTVMPASSRGGLEVMKHGESLYETWTCTANAMFFDGVFQAGDVMWVDGQKPIPELEEKYGYGCTANAVIVSALPVNRTISLVLRSNQKQVKS